ncbi:MCP four helix bundle domain-containing protein, partial [Luteimonas kalidii]
MHRFSNLKLAPRLMLAFGVVLLIMLVQGIGAYTGLRSMDNVTTGLADDVLPSVTLVGETRALLGEYRTASYRGLVRASEAVKQQARQRAVEIDARIAKNLEAYKRYATTPDEQRTLAELVTAWEAARVSYASVNEMLDLELPDDATDTFIGETSRLHDAAGTALAALADEANQVALASRADARGAYASSSVLLLILLLAGIGVGLAIAWLMARNLTRAAREAVSVANDVAGGKLDSHIDTRRADEIGDLLRAMQRMQHDLRERIERDQAIASENLRIRTALESVSTNVMIADTNRNIVYINGPLQKMMSDVQEDIRRDLPEFDAAALVGSNIDGFHRAPEHQATMLARLQSTHRAQIHVGGRTMQLVINPILDADGGQEGFVVEWADRTAEIAVEAEVSRIVAAAASGDLSGRVRTDDKAGFLLQLAEQLNSLLDANAASLSQVSDVLSALAEGNLTTRMDGDFHGVFATMRDNANATMDRLSEIVGQIRSGSDAINAAASEIASGNSDLSRRT